MKEKILSIIIPVYNAEKYIGNLLKKFEQQKNDEVEIILIDDGSKDRSLDICRRFAANNKCLVVFHQKNQGASAARNRGIEISTGEHIVFVDSDDDISNDFVKKVCVLCKDTSADLIQLDSYIENSKKSICKRVELPNGKIAINEYCIFVLRQTTNPPWDKIYRAEVIRNNKILFDTDMVMGEDISFTLEFLKYANTVCVEHVAVYKYKKNAGGLCSNVTGEYLKDLDTLFGNMESFIRVRDLKNIANEIMYKSMLQSVFRAVGLSISNNCSVGEIKQKTVMLSNVKKILIYNYKNIFDNIRKLLLNVHCYRGISILVKCNQNKK